MKRIFLCLFLINFILPVTGQNTTIKGVLLDSLSKEPLEYANIYVVGTKLGTTSNERGFFEIENNTGENMLRFGYVGYKSKDIDYSIPQQDTILLNRDNEQLKEVLLQSPKFKKSVKIKGAKGSNHIGVSNTNNGESPGALLRFFKVPSEFRNQAAFLNSAEFYLFKSIDSENREFLFRIRIMSVSENGNPGYDLIEHKTLQGKPGSKVKIDLEDERILLPKNGFFVGVEGLQIAQNYIRTQKLVLKNGNTKALKQYGPTFKGVPADGPLYYYGSGEWRKLRMPAPAINLEITN